MKKSVWTTSAKLPEFPKLQEDIKTGVLIIGGGICGLLCAYMLRARGIDCILAEGSTIASGITENTTAKLTLAHGLIYSDLISSAGRKKAEMYLEANRRALSEYEKLCAGKDVDYEHKTACTYSTSDRERIEKEITALRTMGIDADFVTDLEIPLKVEGAVSIDNQAQFNPLKFIGLISDGLNIYENTFIQNVSGNTAYAGKYRITAKKIVFATHFPSINRHGAYFLKLFQHRSYLSAYEGIPELRGMYADADNSGLSFRSYADLTLIGGGGHRTGKKSNAWRDADEFVKNHYPEAKLLYQWAAQDTMSLDSVPYIGRYSAATDDWYVATGFNKWGFTSSMVAADIICDMVVGRKNEYAEVFSPHRSMLKPGLFSNSAEALINLLSPTTKRCPHMGCALKWNKAEHTWDCPCHGSRFRKDGSLIDNPAKRDAKSV